MSKDTYTKQEVLSLLEDVYTRSCMYKKTSVRSYDAKFDCGLKDSGRSFAFTGVSLDSLRMVITSLKHKVVRHDQ